MVTVHHLTPIANFAAFNWSNPWLVGIGTAVVSGLIVNFASRIVWNRKDDKELRQKIDSANHEVIYSLRPSLAEGLMPSSEIIDSLMKATARKYALEKTNLLTLDEFADELIKDVMDSSFISHQQKVSYCLEISKIKTSSGASSRIKVATVDSEKLMRYGTTDPYYVYRKNLRQQAIYALSILAALMSLASAFIVQDSSSISKTRDFMLLFSLGILMPVSLAYAIGLIRKLNADKRHKEINAIFEKYTRRPKKPSK